MFPSNTDIFGRGGSGDEIDLVLWFTDRHGIDRCRKNVDVTISRNGGGNNLYIFTK